MPRGVPGAVKKTARKRPRGCSCHCLAIGFCALWQTSFLKDFPLWPNNPLSRLPKPPPRR